MIHQQRWIPDTCANPAAGDSCSLIEEWDDEVSDVARTHAFVRVEKLCSFHKHLPHQDAYEANYEQNRRKNTAFAIAQTLKNDLAPEQFRWAYDASGLLTVDFGGALNNAQKQAHQNAANIQFGAGKIKVF